MLTHLVGTQKVLRLKTLPNILFIRLSVSWFYSFNLCNSSVSFILPPPVSPTPFLSGTMVKEYLWWSTRTRRCMSQLSFSVTCSPRATMMTMRKRSQVRGAVLTSAVTEVTSGRWMLLTVCLAQGGRNGYGAKLCNIFSTKFTVETACKEYRHSFKQVRMFLLLKVLW